MKLGSNFNENNFCILGKTYGMSVKNHKHMTRSSLTATGYYGYSTGSEVIQYGAFVS